MLFRNCPKLTITRIRLSWQSNTCQLHRWHQSQAHVRKLSKKILQFHLMLNVIAGFVVKLPYDHGHDDPLLLEYLSHIFHKEVINVQKYNIVSWMVESGVRLDIMETEYWSDGFDLKDLVLDRLHTVFAICKLGSTLCDVNDGEFIIETDREIDTLPRSSGDITNNNRVK
jgi:hypothetical protein